MKEKVVAYVYQLFAATYMYTICNLWKKSYNL